MEFKPGDKVRHRSGPRKMVVVEIDTDGRVGCRWYKAKEDRFDFQYFQPEELELVEEK